MLTAVSITAAFLMGVVVGGIGCFFFVDDIAFASQTEFLRYSQTHRGILRRLGYALFARDSSSSTFEPAQVRRTFQRKKAQVELLVRHCCHVSG
jgi:hypothetical protein